MINKNKESEANKETQKKKIKELIKKNGVCVEK
jgi:hypothetical protein